jgi:serine/threonine protein kinase
MKPENILLTSLGTVKITDLGLAKPTDQDLSLTESGMSLGTPYYMAPEQGRNAKHVDHRADIYALGGVLYNLLTGELPFHGNSMIDLLHAKEKGSYPPMRRFNNEVPDALELIVSRMLARDLRYRYQSCNDFLDDTGALGLAHSHLGFNVLRVCHALQPVVETPATPEQVEVLLIQDDPQDVHLAQEALEQGGVPCNLSVARDGIEALAFLRREGSYSRAPRPELIILGLDPTAPDWHIFVREFRNSVHLHDVPLVIVSSRPEAATALEELGLPIALRIADQGDLPGLEGLLQSVRSLRITLVDRETKSR